jgi:hypothetical protein
LPFNLREADAVPRHQEFDRQPNNQKGRHVDRENLQRSHDRFSAILRLGHYHDRSGPAGVKYGPRPALLGLWREQPRQYDAAQDIQDIEGCDSGYYRKYFERCLGGIQIPTN